jgi:hypothetical protein
MRFFLLVMSVTSFWRSTQAQQEQPKCTMCADGSMGNVQLSMGSLSCEYIATVASTVSSDSSTCMDLQMQAYQYCACPTYPTDAFCSVCQNGSMKLFHPLRSIPLLPRSMSISISGLGGVGNSMDLGGNYYTCREVMFARNDGSDVCTIVPKADYLCGCPKATPPSCTMCPPSNTSDAIVAPNKRIPPLFTTTCEQIRFAAYMMTSEAECSSLLTSAPVDLPAYCGCTDSKVSSSICSLCGSGTPHANPDLVVDEQLGLTCGMMLSAVAPYVTSPDYCTALQARYQSMCCTSSEPVVVIAPTPVQVPVNPPPTLQPTPLATTGATTPSLATVVPTTMVWTPFPTFQVASTIPMSPTMSMGNTTLFPTFVPNASAVSQQPTPGIVTAFTYYPTFTPDNTTAAPSMILTSPTVGGVASSNGTFYPTLDPLTNNASSMGPTTSMLGTRSPSAATTPAGIPSGSSLSPAGRPPSDVVTRTPVAGNAATAPSMSSSSRCISMGTGTLTVVLAVMGSIWI